MQHDSNKMRTAAHGITMYSNNNINDTRWNENHNSVNAMQAGMRSHCFFLCGTPDSDSRVRKFRTPILWLIVWHADFALKDDVRGIFKFLQWCVPQIIQQCRLSATAALTLQLQCNNVTHSGPEVLFQDLRRDEIRTVVYIQRLSCKIDCTSQIDCSKITQKSRWDKWETPTPCQNLDSSGGGGGLQSTQQDASVWSVLHNRQWICKM